MRVLAKAPSNIALIKYMGKDDARSNLPANASISMTLDSLCTFAEAAPIESPHSVWRAELPASERLSGFPAAVPKLSETGMARILLHVDRVGELLEAVLPAHGISVNRSKKFEIRTANTFPSAAGIASSASSFAAVSLAVAGASAQNPRDFKKRFDESPELRRALAEISRQGSGSSCRSFEGPWVLWENAQARALETKMPEMVDFVLLIDSGEKTVSSSEAHKAVKTSPLWHDRTGRVSRRIALTREALAEGDIRSLANIAWSEFWEMHSLFHTCAEPFTYWEPGTVQALKWFSSRIKSDHPPVVTMDAGANVHVLVPFAQSDEWNQLLHCHFPQWKILSDRQGTGASVLEITESRK